MPQAVQSLCPSRQRPLPPTEVVSDKIPSLLAFFDKVPLHVTRAVRWDSDHVVLFEDELKEIAKEIVRNDAMDKVLIGLDFFDASINRVAAWVIGTRNMQKALLYALLQPNKKLKELQDSGRFTELMMLQEELKTFPFGDIWEEYCESHRCLRMNHGLTPLSNMKPTYC